MEPDHFANIKLFAEKYPDTKIVATAKAFTIMNQFFGTKFDDRQIVVSEKDTLSLGKHNLTFITTPMVHWPEVMVTYDSYDKVLFSADGFGKFGTTDADEDWACEARRYYFGIVGKYGAQVQALLKKVPPAMLTKSVPYTDRFLQKILDITLIYTTHGHHINLSRRVYLLPMHQFTEIPRQLQKNSVICSRKWVVRKLPLQTL